MRLVLWAMLVGLALVPFTAAPAQQEAESQSTSIQEERPADQVIRPEVEEKQNAAAALKPDEPDKKEQSNTESKPAQSSSFLAMLTKIVLGISLLLNLVLAFLCWRQKTELENIQRTSMLSVSGKLKGRESSAEEMKKPIAPYMAGFQQPAGDDSDKYDPQTGMTDPQKNDKSDFTLKPFKPYDRDEEQQADGPGNKYEPYIRNPQVQETSEPPVDEPAAAPPMPPPPPPQPEITLSPDQVSELLAEAGKMSGAEFGRAVSELGPVFDVITESGTMRLGNDHSPGSVEIQMIAIEAHPTLYVLLPSYTYIREFSMTGRKASFNSDQFRSAFELDRSNPGSGLHLIELCAAAPKDGHLIIAQKGKLGGYSD